MTPITGLIRTGARIITNPAPIWRGNARLRSFTPVADNGGMTPSAWINGGAGVTIDWAVVESALGPMLLAATDKAICRL